MDGWMFNKALRDGGADVCVCASARLAVRGSAIMRMRIHLRVR